MSDLGESDGEQSSIERIERRVEELSAILKERGVQDDERRSIARRVQLLEDYCHSTEPSLEGLQTRVRHIPPDALRASKVLHWACEYEEVTFEMIKCLLDAFPDATRSIDEDGDSPLNVACANSKLDPRIVGLLLDSWRESVNHRNEMGDLPLHILCKFPSDSDTDSLEILDQLLTAAPLSARIAGSEGYLPIHFACRNGQSYLFCRTLIDAYPQSLRVQAGGGLPIHRACYAGCDVDTVEYMLELYQESIEVRDGGGNLPIHFAARSDGQDTAAIIRYLLAKDPACASKTGVLECLPLHVACGTDCLESVRILFDAYPEAINIRDEDGETPLDIAREDEELVELYQEVRGFLEAQLVYARLAEDRRVMHTPDENGWLPLHHALKNGASLGAIKLLIAGNQDALQVSDNQSASPLHIACESGYLGAVEYLLERGVPSVLEENSDGKLPVHLLWESDRVDRDSMEYVEANWLLLHTCQSRDRDALSRNARTKPERTTASRVMTKCLRHIGLMSTSCDEYLSLYCEKYLPISFDCICIVTTLGIRVLGDT